MLKFWWLLLLPFLLFEEIVCPSGDMLNRRDRSTYYDKKPNANNYMENFPNEYRSRKTQQQQQQQQYQQRYQKQQQQQQELQEQQPNEHAAPSVRSAALNDTLSSVFKIGSERGVVLFNTTSDPYLTHIPHMQADQSFIDKSSNQEQAFKVQRTPDGKLNLVFNDFLFLQKAATRTTPRPIAPDFIFPDQKQYLQGTGPRCEESDSFGKTFCTKVQNYPDEAKVEAILSQDYSKFEAFFGDDMKAPENISTRINTDPEEDYFCKSRSSIVYPKLGLTKNLNWELIVNNQKNKQGVAVEECSNHNATCDVFQSIPLQYETRCAQQYSFRMLVAILTNGTVVREEFKLPSACKCAFKLRNGSL